MSALRLASLTTWTARLAWLVAAIVGGRAVGAALADASRPVQVVGTVGAWLGFAAGAVALLVPSTAALTAARAIVPAAVVVAIACAVAGADAVAVAELLAPAAIATLAVATAEFGRSYLQASAYGAEQRFGLRPPVGYLVATAVSWALTVAAVIAAPLALAARSWLLGGLALAVAAIAVATLPRRWHQLSRRWFVLVPAGAVVHDPIVLGETLMAERRNLAAVTLDDARTATTRSVDLTGPTPGPVVELVLREPVPAYLRAGTRGAGIEAVELERYVISPTRPGALLHAVRAAGLAQNDGPAIPPPRTSASPAS